MANDITQQFAGLPIEDLIVQPLVGMAKGQAQLNDVTWKYISQVAFEKDADAKDDKAPLKAKSLSVTLNRFVTNPETGAQDIQYINSQVPLLPLVPLPALSITSADIEFSMEVKSTEMSKDSTDTSAEASAEFDGGFWGMKYKVSMTGKIATHKENTRSTDNSAKYNVKVHAEQLPPTEGMLKLSDYLTQMLEPSVMPMTENKNM